jgi:hypothetical protein
MRLVPMLAKRRAWMYALGTTNLFLMTLRF